MFESFDQFNPLDEDQSNTVFRDVTLLALSGFVAIVLLLLPWLNLKTKSEVIKEPVGSVIIELFWNDDIDADLDLWVKGPNDGPVGYSKPSGLVFNLLRDDRGLTGDYTPLNYEISFTRGIVAGEYQANVHLFRNNKSKSKIQAMISASLVTPDRNYRKQILEKTVLLSKEGKEKTVLRFKLDNNFKLVSGSVNSLRKSLIGGI
jgi:hypothetical protein